MVHSEFFGEGKKNTVITDYLSQYSIDKSTSNIDTFAVWKKKAQYRTLFNFEITNDMQERLCSVK